MRSRQQGGVIVAGLLLVAAGATMIFEGTTGAALAPSGVPQLTRTVGLPTVLAVASVAVIAATRIRPRARDPRDPQDVLAVAARLHPFPWGGLPESGVSIGTYTFVAPMGEVGCSGSLADFFDDACRRCRAYGAERPDRVGFAVPTALLRHVTFEGRVWLVPVDGAWLRGEGLPVLVPAMVPLDPWLDPLVLEIEELLRQVVTNVLAARVHGRQRSPSGAANVRFELAVGGALGPIAVRGGLLLRRDGHAIPTVGRRQRSWMHATRVDAAAPGLWLDPGLVASIADGGLTAALLRQADQRR